MKPPPVVRYAHSGKTHYVFASGSPEDGSLHGMYTYCSRQIDLEALPDGWVEEKCAEVTCGTCKNSERAGRPHREAQYYRNVAQHFLLVCEELLKDAEDRPGAYLHVNLSSLRFVVRRAREGES